MIDTSDEAIEADLERAARGGPAAATWVAWAQIRATLRQGAAEAPASGRPPLAALPTGSTSPDIQIAVGPFGDSYTVPATAAWDDRVTAAARMLGLTWDQLADALQDREGVELERAAQKVAPIVVEAPAEPDFELDIDEDEVDEDFFAEAREARDR